MIPEKQWEEMVESAMKRKHEHQRARFAAMAMQTLLNRSAYNEDNVSIIARWSVKAADALIKELNK
jgi:hypothetical protein